MDFDDYQLLASRTANLSDPNRLVISGLGVTGEAGEVAELIKKHVGHGHPLDRDKLAKELGDVLWYISDIATACEMNLAEIAEGNIKKLRERYPEGFSTKASINRRDYVKNWMVD